jgi:hypothetical protein
MITIPVATLHAVAPNKPAGYVTACLAAGTVENGILHIAPAEFARIRGTYSTPSLVRQAVSLGKALVHECRSIAADVEPVTNEAKAARHAICAECEFMIASENRCSKCGCNLEAKAAMRSQSCPLGKWPRS